jgi:anaerobic ribonucleoside-triphosphate reductase activating protein
MLKFEDTNVGFEEIPERVSLNIFITNCPFTCEGCHSPELREDFGTELTISALEDLLVKNQGVNCVTFMGDGQDPEGIVKLGAYIKDTHPSLDTAVYSGRTVYSNYFKTFDFIKLGGYKEECGALGSRTTNQRMYKKCGSDYKDVTADFWAIYNRVYEVSKITIS